MKTRKLGLGTALGACTVLVLTALMGCNEHPLQALEETVTAVNRQENRLPAKTKIDFLFVVDNSGSMCEEQDNLTANFSAFTNFLFRELGASADYRIAVTSTDMNPENPNKGSFLADPAVAAPSLNCVDRRTNEPNVPNTEDCQDLIDNNELEPIIKSGVDGNITDEADLERKFRCLATLGTQGDGFEKGLEAMRIALSCGGPNRAAFGSCCVEIEEQGRRVWRYNPACQIPEGEPEPDFLRPDAVLVVIVVSDEDDCSDPATNPGASRRAICKYATTDGDGNGIPDGFNDPDLCGNRSPADCYRAECGNIAPDECKRQRCEIPRTENNACEWYRSDLTPVQDYYRFLTSLKASPLEQLVMATIVGQRDYTPNGFEITYNIGPAPAPECDRQGPDDDREILTSDMCCPDGRCRGEIATSCESANGEAFSGRRYLQLAEAFAENGIGCPPPPENLQPDSAQVVACNGQPRDGDCQYESQGAVVDGQCRPIEGAGTLACVQCVTICEDNFAQPLQAIKEKVAEIVATYCLDKPPACQVSTPEGTTRNCEGDVEINDPANYPIRVRMQCLLTEEQEGECQEVLPPTVLARNQWSLELDQAQCPGGAVVQLSEPPPAGAEVFVEFLVSVGDDQAPAAEEPAAEGAGGAGGEADPMGM